ncbi:hypothetical protein SBA1_70013 [Candidatus Sulfotelmatobacter kueseliae]|uniref:Uncharacterized protein n=1 Tax=Candidatus Sulfotelmatobacter kueseliae TaxID=2042962 RepID=A0A2U3L511_9BACT|nr:hypothetical protein SBA1_70013 [Candidatus Sulfotelmatobacter kueseliae]
MVLPAGTSLLGSAAVPAAVRRALLIPYGSSQVVKMQRHAKKPEPEGAGCPVGCVPG